MTQAEAKQRGATHYTLNPSRDFIELFYKVGTAQMNDGTTSKSIQYLSSFNVWMGTRQDHEKIEPKLIPLT